MKKKLKVNNIKELTSLAKKEKVPRFRDKLKALLAFSKGVKIKYICTVLNVHERTFEYIWLAKWNQGGYSALIDKPRIGRTPLIPKEIRSPLREYVLSCNKRIVCKDLVKYVKEKYDIDCDEETVRKVLKSMKLSWQKPDKVNHKADEKKQKVFLKGTLWC